MYSLENRWRVEISPLLQKTSIRSEIFSPAIRRITTEVKTGNTSLPNAISGRIEKESERLASRCYHRSPKFPGVFDLIKSWYPYPARQIRLTENYLRFCSHPYSDKLENFIQLLKEDPTGFLVIKTAVELLNPASAKSWNEDWFIFETATSGMERYRSLYEQLNPFQENPISLPEEIMV